MKMIAIRIVFVLISGLGCLDLAAQDIQILHPVTGNELDSNDLPNHVQFQVSNLLPPPSNPNSNQAPSWGYLWTFGDCSLPSTQRAPIHNYDPQNGNYEVKLILTPKYADEDEELPMFSKAITVTGPFTTEEQTSTEYDFETGMSITTEPVRDCKPGDLNTFLIHFENPGSSVYYNSKVKFHYNAQFMSFDSSYVDGCGYTGYTHGTSSSGHEGLLTFDINELGPGDEGFLTLSLLTKTQASIGGQLQFKSELYGNQSHQLISDHVLHMEVKNSHDPNDKSVRRIGGCAIDSLVYTVQFENEGTADAELVYIIDEIDPQLDINSIRILNASHASNTLPIIDSISLSDTFNPHFLPFQQAGNTIILLDTFLRRLALVHNQINLVPSSLVPSVEGGSISTGQGHFEYSIQLDSLVQLGSSSTIGAHAEIYFDDNHPISTRAPMANRTQCYCQPQFNNSQMQWIHSIKLNTINKTSGNDGGYANYRDIETGLNIGNFHSVTLSPGFMSGPPSTVYWQIYVDFDRNGQFSSSESVFAGSGTSQVTGTVSIPTSVMPGPSAMRVVMSDAPYGANCSQAIDGEIEDYSITLQHPLLPDLEIVDRSITPYRIIKGDSMTSTYTVRNQGLDSSKATNSINYYLSSDIHFDPTDYFLTTQPIPPLAAQTEISGSTRLILPAWAMGNQYVILVVDEQQNMTENDETNNTALLKVWVREKQADLHLKNPKTCHKQFKSGSLFDIDFEIENKGLLMASSTPNGIPIVLYLSHDRVLSTNDTPLDTCWLDSVSADTSFSYSLGSKLPTQLMVKPYFLLLKIDPDNLISEARENNNIARVKIYHTGDEAAKIPFYTGFECGNTGVSWHIEDSLSARVLVSDIGNPYADDFHLLLKSSSSSGASWADLKLDLSGTTSQSHFLSFQWKDFDTGQSHAFDGMYLSDDGIQFVKALDFNSTTGGWQSQCLWLDSLDSTYQLNLSSTLWVRFQLKGNTSSVAQLAIDELSVSATNCSNGNLPFKPMGVSPLPKLGMSLYPNPGFESTHLEYWCSGDETSISLEIRDFTGRLIQQPFARKRHESGSYTIQIHSLPPGQYWCILQGGSSLASERLVILR